jgi:predicted O-linked N-acetylglucosamine transferase (SPINDLY family)
MTAIVCEIAALSRWIRIDAVSIQEEFEQAVRHHQAGRMQQAETLYRQVLARQADHADALCGLGFLASQTGQGDLGASLIRQAVALRPQSADYPLNLGLLLSSQGKWEESIPAFGAAVLLDPQNPAAHYSLGHALQNLGRWDESAASYERAIALRPEYFQAFNNLGVVQQSRGDIAAAIAAYRRSIELQPGHPEAHNNLGVVLQEQGQIDLAIASYRQALALRPNYAQAQNNLANAIRQTDLDGAIDGYKKAIALAPNYADAHNNLAEALKDSGQLDEAVAHYRAAMKLRPQDAALHSNWLFLLQFHPDWGGPALLREHRLWDQKHAQPLARINRPSRSEVSPKPRLRIGYVSPDFKDHCQSFFTLPLFEKHDRGRFEIFCYSSVARPDAITARLRGSVEHWRDVAGVPDAQLAKMIAEDGIVILVDLTMHMANGRLLTFAHKPAPVQVAWLAYPGTTGLEAMDYRLTDPYLDPPGQNDGLYSERSIRLADSFWCYEPLDGDVPVNHLPALSAGHFTFGCLNNFCKVNRDVLELWAAVLRAVGGSRLVLLAPRGQARQRVAQALERLGIDPSRLEFVDRQARREYFRMYHRIDLGLDTFPYNGHTTSLDSLWMGVPPITLVGRTAVGRAGWSQLNNLALGELAADTQQKFVQIASEWAGDLPRLSRLRASLRDLMLGSALCDPSRFTRNVEAAYEAMWQSAKN